MTAFDADRPWALGSQVALRPEPFGALAYHFGTRRLSLLKRPALVTLVRSLEQHATARAAVDALDIPTVQVPAYEAALARLASTDMIEPRRTA
jgi:putative mycofactocin binding protein MftB